MVMQASPGSGIRFRMHTYSALLLFGFFYPNYLAAIGRGLLKKT